MTVQTYTDVQVINDLCQRLGQPHAAAGLIARKLNSRSVLRELLTTRSSELRRMERGSSTLGASHDREVSVGTSSNPLLAAVYRRLESQGRKPAGESSTAVAENVRSTVQSQPSCQPEPELAAASENPVLAATVRLLRSKGIQPNMAHLGGQR